MAAEKTSQRNASPLDFLLWVFAALLVAGGIVGYNYFADDVLALVRALGLIAAVGAALFVVAKTAKGKELFLFFKEADVERRKVVWPTRQETLQTALMVIVITTLLGIILFVLDRLWGWVIRTLISSAGGG